MLFIRPSEYFFFNMLKRSFLTLKDIRHIIKGRDAQVKTWIWLKMRVEDHSWH